MANRENGNFLPVESEVDSEKEIIAEILENKIRDKAYEHEEGSIAYKLNYGKKLLVVTFNNTEEPYVSTFVTNMRSESFEKDGETTILYKAAKKLMLDFVNERGKPLNYRFMTGDSTMEKWAQSKGREIFNWDSEYNSGGQEFPMVFAVEIVPDENHLDKAA